MFRESGGVALEQSEQERGSQAFGSYLRKLREGRRLSLDAVEEMSSGFPEKVTKSHLSRIEHGLAQPSFARLMAMSHIYGVPIAAMAERYEVALRRGMTALDLGERSDVEILEEIERLRRAGEINEALSMAWSLFDRRGESGFSTPIQDSTSFELRGRIIYSLILAGKLESAKTLAEEVLSARDLSEPQRLLLLELLANASYQLRRFPMAMLAIDECRKGARASGVRTRFAADIDALAALVERAMGRPAVAITLHESAIEQYTALGITYEATSSSINLAQALSDSGANAQARDTIVRVIESLESGSLSRLRAIAYAVRAKIEFRDEKIESAEKWATKSNLIARQIEVLPVVFRNCFYLWKIALAKGDAAAVRLNERTLRSLVGRIESDDPELDEFRDFMTRADS